MTDKGILFVHAHPDDESIGNGATMAKYVSEGARVSLVTCTAGEEGEVIVPDLAHIAAAHEDRLGPVRQVELARAMSALDVTDHRFLGGFGTYRDSGMMGTEPNNRPDCFWQADLLEAAKHLVAVIREVRPQVLVTYDDFGGYGHPDHIKAHRVAMYAYVLAGTASFAPELGESWSISKVYWNASPRSEMQAGIDAMKAAGISNEFTEMNLEEFQFLCDDNLVAAEINAVGFAQAKLAALDEHKTQLDINSGFFAAFSHMGDRALGTEFYRLVAAPTGYEIAPGTRETDLFAGI
jgi:N-acetyl-1-D-myo-inositol-2-amino-2-deoxy-alpha-D-glucopyranoside deacetylase